MGARELFRDRRGVSWDIASGYSLSHKLKPSCAEMNSKLDLAGIAECAALQRLTFYVRNFDLRAPFLSVNDDVVDELAVWCQEICAKE